MAQDHKDTIAILDEKGNILAASHRYRPEITHVSDIDITDLSTPNPGYQYPTEIYGKLKHFEEFHDFSAFINHLAHSLGIDNTGRHITVGRSEHLHKQQQQLKLFAEIVAGRIRCPYNAQCSWLVKRRGHVMIFVPGNYIDNFSKIPHVTTDDLTHVEDCFIVSMKGIDTTELADYIHVIRSGDILYDSHIYDYISCCLLDTDTE